MFTRSARLVKLATKESEEHVMDKNKSIDLNISTSTDIDEETDKRESPLPSGFENQLIKLNELLGDVFNEDDASTKENIEPTAPLSEKIQSTSSTTKNIEPTVSSAENIEPIASTSTHFEIIVDHEITPMPSPSSNEICDDTFCVGYAESENPPILTNDDLYGNLPTPSYDGEMTVSDDKRGKYIHKANVMDEEMIRSVCDHVKSFSLVESHYIRKDSKKLYLEDVKSASRMFNLYSEWFDSDKYRNKASTKRQYRDILNANFNIGFHKPKKDLCDVCHVYCNKEIPTEEEKSAFLKHQSAKKAARVLKQQDKNEAISNEEIVAATFDFEKVLVTPHGDVSVFYYKRKLSTLNFTLYELATKEATCFMWHEAIAKRGANEVSSCLYQFIKQKVIQNKVKTFRFWSDNCAGQNRNRIVFALYLLAAKEFGVTITHRFMEKGHTQNEGDSVHSTIERASDRRLIYVPEEWYCLVRWAKAEGNPYKVIEMKTSDIYDFKSLLANKNWSKNSENEKIQWTRLREVTVHALHYDRIEYKYNFEDEPKTIKILRSGNRNTERLSREFEIKQAYDGDLPISRNKYKDLINLCQTNIIPEKYHNFYQKLKFDQNVQEPLEDIDED
ncbi:unnamed protein product [Spodoptera exigua]|nr:unnamed protein product [Spodoptera exigua]